MSSQSLSSRGAEAAATPPRIDYDAFREAERDRYHPTDNPGGALPLNIAENRLSWPELRRRIGEIAAESEIPDWVPGYTSPRGAPEFREAAARFLSAHLARCPVDPDGIAVSAGATSVIEMTAFILAEPGDLAVIPAPCYPVYTRDLANFVEVGRYDLVTHHHPAEIAEGPVLDENDLDRAYADIEASGRRFRMLIVTTPDNPTGGVYPVERLERIARWCVDRSIHLVVNEIYGLSLIDTDHPDVRDDYRDPEPFRSFVPIMEREKSEYLHLWYALSKDLGISGFRVGLAYSKNETFVRAYNNLNLTHSISNHTQWLLGRLLGDTDFMRAYIERNQERLTASYALGVKALRRMDVPYVPSRGSLFLWIDLSEFLETDSEEGEMELWDTLFRDTGVLFTPGIGFGHTKRGMFRMVYPCVTLEELSVAMERLADWVEARRG